jgi:hypothetical protein
MLTRAHAILEGLVVVVVNPRFDSQRIEIVGEYL